MTILKYVRKFINKYCGSIICKRFYPTNINLFQTFYCDIANNYFANFSFHFAIFSLTDSNELKFPLSACLIISSISCLVSGSPGTA